MMQKFVEVLVGFSANYLMPLMLMTFVIGIFSRYLVYYTVKRSDWFAVEFEKRSLRYIDTLNFDNNPSYYQTVRKLLEITFYESFEMREKHLRRRGDQVNSFTDRIFLVKQGSAWLVKDILRQLKILRHTEVQNFHSITKSSLESNPCFNKLFGIFPVAGINDLLNILPGMFVIGGIFGTFLGIMQALPELGGMDLSNVEKTKQIMDAFLLKVAFAMSTSIVGIVFSVGLNIVNTVYSPEKVYISMVDRFENSLNLIWNSCKNNDLPKDLESFNEHRDAKEVLAENSIYNEIQKTKHLRTSAYHGSVDTNKTDVA